MNLRRHHSSNLDPAKAGKTLFRLHAEQLAASIPQKWLNAENAVASSQNEVLRDAFSDGVREYAYDMLREVEKVLSERKGA